jgi:hypothetical protein
MKAANVLGLWIVFCFPALADETVNPADYPLTAHVIGNAQGRRPSGGWPCTYELVLNKMFYTAIHNGRNCNASVSAGADFPARIDKHNIKLLVDGKEFSLEIVGTHE